MFNISELISYDFYLHNHISYAVVYSFKITVHKCCLLLD